MNNSTMVKIARPIIRALDSFQAFVSTYIILAFISYIPLLRITLGFLTKLILVWGFYLLIRKVLVKWQLRREKSTWLAIGLLGAYLIACLINYQWDLAINLLNFSYATLNLIILFAMNSFDSLAALLKSFRQTAGLVVGLSFASSLLSIGMFFFDIKYLVVVDGFTINQGFIYGRLWGVYSSPNSAAMLAIFSLGLTTALLLAPGAGRRLPGTVFGVLNLLVQFTFAALSGSRGYILSILAFSMTLVFFGLMILIRKKAEIRQHGLRVTAMLVIALLAVAAPLGTPVLNASLNGIARLVPAVANRLLFSDYNLVAQTSLAGVLAEIERTSVGALPENQIVETSAAAYAPTAETSPTLAEATLDDVQQLTVAPDVLPLTAASEVPVETAAPVYVSRPFEVSDVAGDLRFKIWQTSIKALLRSQPVFGLANLKTIEPRLTGRLTAEELALLASLDANCHNGFIQVAVLSGLTGAALFAALILLWLFKNGKSALIGIRKKPSYLLLAVFAVSIGFFANNLVESHILFRAGNVLGVIGWYLMGFVMNHTILQSSEGTADA